MQKSAVKVGEQYALVTYRSRRGFPMHAARVQLVKVAPYDVSVMLLDEASGSVLRRDPKDRVPFGWHAARAASGELVLTRSFTTMRPLFAPWDEYVEARRHAQDAQMRRIAANGDLTAARIACCEAVRNTLVTMLDLDPDAVDVSFRGGDERGVVVFSPDAMAVLAGPAAFERLRAARVAAAAAWVSGVTP